jgi:hypothetical protein
LKKHLNVELNAEEVALLTSLPKWIPYAAAINFFALPVAQLLEQLGHSNSTLFSSSAAETSSTASAVVNSNNSFSDTLEQVRQHALEPRKHLNN